MTAPHSRIERRLTASKRAGLLRIGFAVAALVFADSLFRDIPGALAFFALYLGMSLLFQLLIMKGYGASDMRSLVMGLLDVGCLSYAVYLLGPASSVLPFVYLLIPVVNAASSSSRSRVSMRLALVGAFVYAGLLAATANRLLPYGPARGAATLDVPGLPLLIASGTLVLLSVISTTSIVLRQMLLLDRMNRRLSELSNLDELTGLFNRRHLVSELRKQLERVQRGATCGVMMIDLDGFKRVNDQMGHEAGDLLLLEVANALTLETRAVDLVARYGGDEFVIVLPDLTGDGAIPAAERIVTAVARVGGAQSSAAPVTASIGLTMAKSDDDVGILLRRADSEAYAAKRAGGNRVSVAITHEATTSGIVSTPPARRRFSGP